jgi:hypothetical protein
MFTGREENDYVLERNKMDFCFGKMKGSKWVDIEPTDGQIEKMQNLILTKVEEIKESKLHEEVEEEDFYYPKYNWS